MLWKQGEAWNLKRKSKMTDSDVFKTSLVPINHEMQSRSYDFLYILTEREDRTGRISAQGLDSMDRT